MKLWGGRFSEDLNKKAFDFSSSIRFDINLIEEDLLVNKAHVKMLNSIGIISSEEMNKIFEGFDTILKEFYENNWSPGDKYEDIHSAIEARLGELIGNESAAKIHTGRSRNDQIATDFRLWTKKASELIYTNLKELQKVILAIAEDNQETIIPGFTHLQRAQPISLAFHLLTYFEMFERDKNRLKFVFNEADVSPLGSGALAGSTIELDREQTKNELNFALISQHALDSVSDRDFAIDFLNAGAVGMMHLSRLCEELILWSSTEFNFAQIGDAYTTGSSLMPQKKNPDIAELIRGKSGRVYGNLVALLSTMKSLPLSYNRDMQEDKEPVLDTFYTFNTSLELMAAMLPTISFNKNRFINELDGTNIFATDIADYLVKKGIPFRDTHHISGRIVKYAEQQKKILSDLELNEFKQFCDLIEDDIFEAISIHSALKRKMTIGSPNPTMVKNRIDELKKVIKD